MGLAVRVIPSLLARGTKLVKGRQFKPNRVVGHVQQAVRIHQSRGVDELVILDVDATPACRGPDFDLIKTLTEECFMPLTVGGGVTSVEDVRQLLRHGADKIAIGTAAWATDCVEEIASVVGNQAIVAAVDVKDDWVFIECGRVICSSKPHEWAQWLERHGAGEILLTSIDREGTMHGYDLELIRLVSDAVSIPVIAHGGCSGPEDMLAAIKAGAHAVAAGALFLFSDHTPKSCAQYLAKHGVETRCT